jgi:alkanesulfonate monooxygenase SsuD/methylene tetrahydromethanopterin reductase-like flavin-dependent oxidoreductase (luciferase family)
MRDEGPSGVRLAVKLPHAHCLADREAILAVAEAAEELGFWGVSVQDHVIADSSVSWCGDSHRPNGDDRVVLEALQTLALVGARTERVKLLTSVLLVPYRNAILLAKELASLDVLSRGRVVAGVGVGAPRGGGVDRGQKLSAHARIARKEFDAFGVRGHRGRLADESLEVLRRIWAEEPATFHGQYYDFDDLEVYPKPAQPRIPIWVGGRSEAARDRAIRLGDAWFPSQISSSLYAGAAEWMRERSRELGARLPAEYGVNIFASVADRDEDAEEANRRTFGRRFDASALGAVTLAGSPDTVVSQMQPYVDVGVRTFDLKLLPPTLEKTLRAMKVVAGEIMPAFSQRSMAPPAKRRTGGSG